jgi:AcrR family transcriptional regulator
MGRRSQHNRDQLEAMMIAAGHDVMRERGFAAFSAREVARRVGYSVGSIYNVFPSLDHLIVAINTQTFDLWAEHLKARLAGNPTDRIRALVEGYFSFARNNRNLWMAIYDHRMPPGMTMPEADAARRAELTAIVIAEVSRALSVEPSPGTAQLARSLIAVVHGHCAFDLNGTFALLDEPDPVGMALARVRDALKAA